MNTTTAVIPVTTLDPIDDLESSLLDSWRMVSEATHRFLKLLREFDLRQGYKAYGNTDCADWLNWKCGIKRTTALEKLRVAKALWSLPRIDAAFAKGDLSYSKVRALTRVAAGINEADLLDYALSTPASELDDYCRRLRNGDPTEGADLARRVRDGRSLTRHFREDGGGTLTVDLPRAELELVMQAIEQVASSLPKDPGRTLFAAAADALVSMARSSLAGGEAGGMAGASSSAGGGTASSGYEVVVHVDAAALEGRGGLSDLPFPTVKRLCCDTGVVPLVSDDRGDVLDVGRKQRTVPTAMKRALAARDRSCQFPGCHHERFLDAHHVEHWADGGETSLDNLVLLCTHHHTLIHEGGFRMVDKGDGSHYFARPDGRPVEVPAEAPDVGPAPAEDSVNSEVRERRPLYFLSSEVDPMAPEWHNRAFSAVRDRIVCDKVQQHGGYHASRRFGQVL